MQGIWLVQTLGTLDTTEFAMILGYTWEMRFSSDAVGQCDVRRLRARQAPENTTVQRSYLSRQRFKPEVYSAAGKPKQIARSRGHLLW
jgi:hypothetical protein